MMAVRMGVRDRSGRISSAKLRYRARTPPMAKIVPAQSRRMTLRGGRANEGSSGPVRIVVANVNISIASVDAQSRLVRSRNATRAHELWQ